MTRKQLEPGVEHPITITKRAGTASAEYQGRLIAVSSETLEMKEASLPAVQYFPNDSLKAELFEPSEHTTYCPYKGEASYLHLRTPDGALIENAVWYYADPFPAVAEIKDHMAFYTSRVEGLTVHAA